MTECVQFYSSIVQVSFKFVPYTFLSSLSYRPVYYFSI